MDRAQVLTVIEECVHYEWLTISEEREEPEWDIEATAAIIYNEIVTDQEYVEWLSRRMEWEQVESIHHRALDYFSSYEPVWKEKENA